MNPDIPQNNEFSTSDLFQAALLYLERFKLLRVESGFPRATFVFADRSACAALIEAYWRREAHVDACGFAEAYCSLKTRLRQR
ncbi:MAG: hypothetical protein WC732_01880 [Candidatus Omnitrophota bacterium]